MDDRSESLLNMLVRGMEEIERATGRKITGIYAGPKAYRRIVLEAGGPVVYENISVELIGSTEA